MFISKKHIPRRTFLRGAGITIALPLLDSMIPAQTPLAKTAANPQCRLGFVYVPHGAVMDKWTPVGEGTGFEFSPTLTPLAPFRDRLTIVSGLAHKSAESLGDGAGDHARSAVAYLSGAHPKKTGGADVRAGITADQIAARSLGKNTPLPSLELAIEDTSLVGTCDFGYSCAYQNTISWSSPTSPLPMEINPRVVFERMFGDGASGAERLARLEKERSILDSVVQEVAHLKIKLDSRDRVRVSDFLDDVREIERRIQLSEKQGASTPDPGMPIGVPDSFDEHAKLMFDLQAMAYRANITRVSTFMLSRDLSSLVFPKTGVREPFHGLSHHMYIPEKLQKLAVINRYHAELFARFLETLRSTPDGDGTLLDHSLVLYGSSMSDSQAHNHGPLPVLAAGGACGQLQGGRHLRFRDDTPMTNFLLTVLDKVGVQLPSLADSTGKLEV